MVIHAISVSLISYQTQWLWSIIKRIANNDINNLGNVRTAYFWRICALPFTYGKHRDSCSRSVLNIKLCIECFSLPWILACFTRDVSKKACRSSCNIPHSCPILIKMWLHPRRYVKLPGIEVNKNYFSVFSNCNMRTGRHGEVTWRMFTISRRKRAKNSTEKKTAMKYMAE
jgi:hypothetical protein